MLKKRPFIGRFLHLKNVLKSILYGYMQSGALDKLFGSSVRVKIMRLFLANQDNFFELEGIVRRAKVSLASCKKEVVFLKNIGFINERPEKVSETVKLKNGKIANKQKTIRGLRLNSMFPFMRPLKSLLVDALSVDRQKLAKTLSSVGKAKLVIFSGVFINAENSKVDLLVAGDSLNTGRLERIVKTIEAEIGREVIYAFLSSKDFLYRLGMRDKFIREVLDFPHEKAVNKLNI